jgi:hypothetical protein
MRTQGEGVARALLESKIVSKMRSRRGKGGGHKVHGLDGSAFFFSVRQHLLVRLGKQDASEWVEPGEDVPGGSMHVGLVISRT